MKEVIDVKNPSPTLREKIIKLVKSKKFLTLLSLGTLMVGVNEISVIKNINNTEVHKEEETSSEELNSAEFYKDNKNYIFTEYFPLIEGNIKFYKDGKLSQLSWIENNSNKLYNEDGSFVFKPVQNYKIESIGLVTYDNLGNYTDIKYATNQDELLKLYTNGYELYSVLLDRGFLDYGRWISVNEIKLLDRLLVKEILNNSNVDTSIVDDEYSNVHNRLR